MSKDIGQILLQKPAMDERMEFIATSNAFFVGANPIDYSGVQQAIRKLEKASQKILRK